MGIWQKRAAVLALAALLAFAAGCAGGSGGENDANAQPGGQSDKKAEAKPTLRVYVPSNVEEFPPGQDANNNEIKTFLEERTGYKLSWEIQPKENVKEKLNIMMASGDVPDLIVTADKTIFANFAQQGLLAPLDQYIEEAGPRIKSTVPEETWRPVTFNGKKYAIPVPQNQEATTGLMVRKDWLDELGIETPKTVDDIYKALQALKAAGKPIGMTAAGGDGNAFSNLEAIAGAFGVVVPYVVKDGKVVHTRTEPEAKEYLAFMNKLYTEGLLDKEFPVNKKANLTEKLVGGRAAMTTLNWADAKGVVESLKEKDPKAELVYIDPPTGPGGHSGVQKHAPVRSYLMVPQASMHQKEAVDFINKYMDPEVLTVVSYGWEGKHFKREGDLIVATPEAEQIRYRIYYTLWDTVADFRNRVRLKGFSPYYDPTVSHARVDNILNYAPPIDAVEKNNQQLTDLTNEYFVKIITGALPLDAFDQYVQEWYKSGGEETLKAANEWYATLK